MGGGILAETPKNDNDLLRMQQEAIRRVRLMQQRAQQSVGPEAAAESPRHSEPASAAPSRQPPPPARRHSAAPAEKQQQNPGAENHGQPEPAGRPRYVARPQQNPLAALFGRSGSPQGDSLLGGLLDGDSERTMLIVLLMILIDDRTDMSMILALLYLIL